MSSAAVRSKPFVRPVQSGDVFDLSVTMRGEDAAEVYYSSRKSPLAALSNGLLHSSECHAVEWDGRIVAMFGVVGIPGQAGAPWMLASEDLKSIRKTFLRECRPVVERWTEVYRYLTNAVWSKNTVHIEWLRWLGFNFEGSDVRNGETFLHFHRSTHV